MDVMKVQKLNQMAVDLSKHHIVGSREDAVNRAAQIFGEENNFSKPSPSPELQTQQNDLSKDVRRLTFALNDVINHLNEVKIAHSKLEKEFNDFRV
ncbi:MAG: hypothetical protein NDI94_04905, partial [Candidatus Woesearchaeota archaeon]|nr:hypothetical protein [Candidatus Woesearchaeota archaeon]